MIKFIKNLLGFNVKETVSSAPYKIEPSDKVVASKRNPSAVPKAKTKLKAKSAHKPKTKNKK